MHRAPGPAALASLLTLLFLCTPPAHATKRTVVLVADLAASKVSQEDAATISDLLRGELAREAKFVLVQRGEMETIAREMEFQMSGCTEQSCAVQLGQMLNAEKVVVGRVAKLYGQLTISAQVVDMAANDIEFAEEVDCAEGYRTVREAIALLAQKLSAHVPVLAEVKLVRGDLVVFDAGSREGLAVGQRLPVLRSEVLKDADGKPVMEEKKQVGEVAITYANTRDSKAQRLTGEIRVGDYARVGAGQPAVVTPAPASTAAPTPAPTSRVAQPAATAPRSSPRAPPQPTSASRGSYTDPVTGMEFVWVEGGCYQMGSPSSEKGRDSDEGPQHEVCVDGFYMASTEVTNAQYRKYRSSHDSKDYKGNSLNGGEQPAVYVSWEDATAFAKWLSGKTGKKYRLPSEAEWEYAARGGTTTARYWGESAEEACRYANVADQDAKRKWSNWTIHNCDDGYAVTAPVGSFEPNPFGLYDMLGNVWEWTADWYGEEYYGKSPRQTPSGPSAGSLRVGRGGCWLVKPSYVRSADRIGDDPGKRLIALGFRLVLSQ